MPHVSGGHRPPRSGSSPGRPHGARHLSPGGPDQRWHATQIRPEYRRDPL